MIIFCNLISDYTCSIDNVNTVLICECIIKAIAIFMHVSKNIYKDRCHKLEIVLTCFWTIVMNLIEVFFNILCIKRVVR